MKKKCPFSVEATIKNKFLKVLGEKLKKVKRKSNHVEKSLKLKKLYRMKTKRIFKRKKFKIKDVNIWKRDMNST